jgi:hypothetical protein
LGEYTEAYEDVLSRCSTPPAPWHIVPADSKWYRNLVIAETISRGIAPGCGLRDDATPGVSWCRCRIGTSTSPR